MKNRSGLISSLLMNIHFSRKRKSIGYLCRGKVGGNMRVRLKGPNVDWDVQLLLKTL